MAWRVCNAKLFSSLLESSFVGWIFHTTIWDKKWLISSSRLLFEKVVICFFKEGVGAFPRKKKDAGAHILAHWSYEHVTSIVILISSKHRITLTLWSHYMRLVVISTLNLENKDICSANLLGYNCTTPPAFAHLWLKLHAKRSRVSPSPNPSSLTSAFGF